MAFISDKTTKYDVRSSESDAEFDDAEFDNVKEGIEKLVKNRLYTPTFLLMIPAPQPIPGPMPKRRGAENQSILADVSIKKTSRETTYSP